MEHTWDVQIISKSLLRAKPINQKPNRKQTSEYFLAWLWRNYFRDKQHLIILRHIIVPFLLMVCTRQNGLAHRLLAVWLWETTQALYIDFSVILMICKILTGTMDCVLQYLPSMFEAVRFNFQHWKKINKKLDIWIIFLHMISVSEQWYFSTFSQ